LQEAEEDTHMEWPFVISLPHSSGRIPEPLRPDYALSEAEIAESVDLGTLEIFGSLPAASVLRASWSRLVADLNRGPGERGPKGIIAQVDYNGRVVYHPGCVPGEDEVERRIREYYMPYHENLETALDRSGVAMVLDCHSLTGVGPPEAPDPGAHRMDIVLGNNGNHQGKAQPSQGRTTCPAEMLARLKKALEKQGFSVSVNNPYAGGYIVTHYGRKYGHRGLMAVQVEINQALFTEGMKLVPERLAQVRDRIHAALEAIAGNLR